MNRARLRGVFQPCLYNPWPDGQRTEALAREQQRGGTPRESVEWPRPQTAPGARAQEHVGPRIARYVGVSPSLVSQIERGRVMPSVGTLYSLANELGLVVDDLFDGTQSPSRQRERGDMTAADVVNPVLKPGSAKASVSLTASDGSA